MKLLIFSDLHIKKEALGECSDALEEVLYTVGSEDADLVVNLGDTFDSSKPSNESLDLFAKFLIHCPVDSIHIIAKSHENEEDNNSVLNHFGILSDKAHFYPEQYELDNILFGHLMVQESTYAFGEKRKAADYAKYAMVFLGHQHSYQKINNVIHVGSSRYITFPEYDDQKVMILYDTETNEGKKIPFNSIIPMLSFEVKEVDTPELILQYNQRLKLKLIFKDRCLYKIHLPYFTQYAKKFVLFKHQLVSKEQVIVTPDKEQKQSLLSSYVEWIMLNVTDVEVKQIMLKEVGYEDY